MFLDCGKLRSFLCQWVVAREGVSRRWGFSLHPIKCRVLKSRTTNGSWGCSLIGSKIDTGVIPCFTEYVIEFIFWNKKGTFVCFVVFLAVSRKIRATQQVKLFNSVRAAHKSSHVLLDQAFTFYQSGYRKEWMNARWSLELSKAEKFDIFRGIQWTKYDPLRI